MVTAGDATKLFPVANSVPPHEPLYHFQLAPVPREPPFGVSVVLLPLQIVVTPFIDVAGTEVSRTTTVTGKHAVLLQVPSARTKYVVVVAGATVRLLPVPTEVPPQLPLYQRHVAPVPKLPLFMLKVVFLPRQIVVGPTTVVAGKDVSCTFTVKLRQIVLLHVPSALTK